MADLTPEQKIALAEANLKEAKQEAKLELLRAEVHATRKRGEIPPELAKRWRNAQNAMVNQRREHRELQIEHGLRTSELGVAAEGED